MPQKKTRSRAGVKAKHAGRGAGELERYEKAVEAFERALKTLYKGEIEKAKEQFESVRQTFPDEGELMDRISTSIAICERKLAPQRKPRSTEEWVTHGVMLLNEGDAAQAIKVLTKALEADPSNPHIAYCLAAAHGRAGEAAESARLLKQAIEADPTSRFHARVDDDFAPVKNRSEIVALLAPAP
jgi:tetratricopeptide (TPR) repeat protein